MTKLQQFFRPKRIEITISPLLESIQVEIEKLDKDQFFFECIDIPINEFKSYAESSGFLESYYSIYEAIEESKSVIDFNDWLIDQDDYHLMMMLLNFLHEKKAVSC